MNNIKRYNIPEFKKINILEDKMTRKITLLLAVLSVAFIAILFAGTGCSDDDSKSACEKAGDNIFELCDDNTTFQAMIAEDDVTKSDLIDECKNGSDEDDPWPDEFVDCLNAATTCEGVFACFPD